MKWEDSRNMSNIPSLQDFYIIPMKIRVYGLCGIERMPRRGVVRRTVRFIPGSTLIGAVTNTYLNYVCDSNKVCISGIQCNIQDDCLLYKLFEAIKGNKIQIFHAVPYFSTDSKINEENPLKNYFKIWKNLNTHLKTKIIPHLGINRSTKTVQLVRDLSIATEEYRGYLYGDETFGFTTREFMSLILIEKSLFAQNLLKIFNLLNLARIGYRSKYCFLDALVSSENKKDADKAVKQFLKDASIGGQRYIACCGIAIMDGENPATIVLKSLGTKLSIIPLSENYGQRRIRVYDEDGNPMFSIYDLLVSTTSNRPRFILVSEPNVELYLQNLNVSPEELLLFGFPNLKLNVFGWNKLLSKDIYESIGA